jgi:hypothetical protein
MTECGNLAAGDIPAAGHVYNMRRTGGEKYPSGEITFEMSLRGTAGSNNYGPDLLLQPKRRN